MTNEFILQDRLQKIKQIINQYGEENFYLSFSGGKDSTVLSALVDLAIPDNKIPRVYADTGIELNMIRDFVIEMQKTDNRIILIKPSVPIKQMLDMHGYPFKSKEYSSIHEHFKKTGLKTHWVRQYLQCDEQKNKLDRYACPKILRYQFTDEFNLKISDNCCKELKEKPLKQWQKINNKPYAILGIMRSEGGRRNHAKCLAFSGNKLKAFQPLSIISKDWENWFIDTYNVEICNIYKPPYNFDRTGCKGCPFNPKLQDSLDILEKYFPAERKQCEIIWKPVYEEYRRLGYRLKNNNYEQVELEYYLKGLEMEE
jgi:3''-phosphoadenosine 5''-phosphosulfate sulfotransferase (PAPS reductase)/FAD synthetase and related enzymes